MADLFAKVLLSDGRWAFQNRVSAYSSGYTDMGGCHGLWHNPQSIEHPPALHNPEGPSCIARSVYISVSQEPFAPYAVWQVPDLSGKPLCLPGWFFLPVSVFRSVPHCNTFQDPSPIPIPSHIHSAHTRPCPCRECRSPAPSPPAWLPPWQVPISMFPRL